MIEQVIEKGVRIDFEQHRANILEECYDQQDCDSDKQDCAAWVQASFTSMSPCCNVPAKLVVSKPGQNGN